MKPGAKRNLIIACAGFMAAANLVASPIVNAKPQRIVSLHLCADQLVLQLADRSAISSVSFIASDPAVSVMANAAEGILTNAGLSEQALDLDPDLIFEGAYSWTGAKRLLRDLGYPVVEIAVPKSVEEIRAQVRRVARLIGEKGRGERLIAQMDTKLATVSNYGGPLPSALFFHANGLTSGTGTLADEILQRAGYRNAAADLGLSGLTEIDLETVIASDPDVLVLVDDPRGRLSLANEIQRHPALVEKMADRRFVSVPSAWLTCATPKVADVVVKLAEARP